MYDSDGIVYHAGMWPSSENREAGARNVESGGRLVYRGGYIYAYDCLDLL